MTLGLAMDVQDLGKDYSRRLRQPGLWGAVKGLVSSQHETVPAVQSISFKIKRGEQVGLIGENGAGKSTTVKMLCGILLPSRGQLEVLGFIPWKQRRQLAARIGVVFGQKPQLLWDIPVRETFVLLREMYGIPPAVYAKTLPKVTDLLDLEPLLNSPVRQLSLGQRMRCDLAAAVLHAPDLAFLDEPTIGLDVVAKQQARELIKWMAREFGSTLVLTTHDLTDITETCARVILLDKGGVLFDGSLKSFESRFAGERRRGGRAGTAAESACGRPLAESPEAPEAARSGLERPTHRPGLIQAARLEQGRGPPACHRRRGRAGF